MAAVGTVRLRIGEEEIVRPPGHKISHVVQKTFDAAQSVGSSATTRARAAFVVPAAFDDCGFGQIFDTSDSLGNVGQVFTGCRHGNVLQVRLSSPGYRLFETCRDDPKILWCGMGVDMKHLPERTATRREQ
jgi:hypothetical protein